MNKKTIKRIIAREGLILLGFIMFSLLLSNIGRYFYFRYWPYEINEINFDSLTFEKEMIFAMHKPYFLLIWIGRYFLRFFYTTYLLIKFITWAIKTLMGR